MLIGIHSDPLQKNQSKFHLIALKPEDYALREPKIWIFGHLMT